MQAGMRRAASLAAMALVGGCGGGGGGGGVVVPETITAQSPSSAAGAAASFTAAKPNQTLAMEGPSVTLSGTGAQGGTFNTHITSASQAAVDRGTYRFSYDGARELSAISVNTPQASFSFDRASPPGSVRCDGPGTCSGFSVGAHLTLRDPVAAGWNYQTFGVWGTQYHPFGPWNVDFSLPAWRAGAFSAGSPTSGNAIPVSGSATFSGLAAGFYFDSTSLYPYATSANMTARVDFAARAIGFSTSDTRLVNNQMGVQATNQGLNLTGTLSYAQGINAITGGVQTRDGALSGQANGRFYGPGAEEIGGIYALQGSGVARMIGGFGGKR